MAGLGNRVDKLERVLGSSDADVERGARQLVEAEIFFQCIDPATTDLEARVRDHIRNGRTVERVLEDIEGSSRGLPCNMPRSMDAGDD
jgi:hypothetical protein